MTATLEQTQSDLPRLVNLVQHGEEVVITSQGRAVAKLSAIPQSAPSASREARLARLR
jgi:antitoxin (DNA-binding transcriptional repressor) of toxin-antitoxin stability system